MTMPLLGYLTRILGNRALPKGLLANFTRLAFCPQNSWLHTSLNRSVPNEQQPCLEAVEACAMHIEDIKLLESFISEAEEQSLLKEIEPYIRRLRYEYDHWDNAIHGYRETEKAKWNEDNMKIINRVHSQAFSAGVSPLKFVHVLDISKEGFIKPHIDSVRFCGDTIAGLSLLSDCVMRLTHAEDPEKVLHVFLPRRSLYILRKSIRYEYNHEILENKLSYFKGKHIPRDRRISVICRNEPS